MLPRRPNSSTILTTGPSGARGEENFIIGQRGTGSSSGQWSYEDLHSDSDMGRCGRRGRWLDVDMDMNTAPVLRAKWCRSWCVDWRTGGVVLALHTVATFFPMSPFPWLVLERWSIRAKENNALFSVNCTWRYTLCKSSNNILTYGHLPLLRMVS